MHENFTETQVFNSFIKETILDKLDLAKEMTEYLKDWFYQLTQSQLNIDAESKYVGSFHKSNLTDYYIR